MRTNRLFWFGLIFTVLFSLAFVFKTFVVWDVSRDLYNGGGVPTLDYPIFYPIFIAIGVSSLLKSIDLYPFPFFGLLLWLTLLGLALLLYWWFDRLGAPIRDAQLKQIQANSNDNDPT